MLEPSIKVSKARARKLLRIKVSKAWTRVGNWNTSVKLMPREFSCYLSLGMDFKSEFKLQSVIDSPG